MDEQFIVYGWTVYTMWTNSVKCMDEFIFYEQFIVYMEVYIDLHCYSP